MSEAARGTGPKDTTQVRSMKIAFASCAKVQCAKRQRAWDRIADLRPNLLLLLGDNVYLDDDEIGDPRVLKARLDDRYQEQLGVPSFRRLTDQLVEDEHGVLAIWDDHDSFGDNRAGGDAPGLVPAATASFLENMTFRNPRTTVHTVRDYGDLVRIIALDVRSWRKAPHADTSNNAVLGEAQWTWFEEQLTTAKTKWILVCSGTCFYQHRILQTESWQQYPCAAERMMELMSAKGRVFLSGDIHENTHRGTKPGGKNTLVELVSSGVARPLGLANFGFLTLDETTLRVRFHNSWKLDSKVDLSLDRWPRAR